MYDQQKLYEWVLSLTLLKFAVLTATKHSQIEHRGYLLLCESASVVLAILATFVVTFHEICNMY